MRAESERGFVKTAVDLAEIGETGADGDRHVSKHEGDRDDGPGAGE
jgi:hypothetical protein